MSIINFVKFEPDAPAVSGGASGAQYCTICGADFKNTHAGKALFNPVHGNTPFCDVCVGGLPSVAEAADAVRANGMIPVGADGKELEDTAELEPVIVYGCGVGDYAAEIVSDVRAKVQLEGKYPADSFLSEAASSHFLKGALHLCQAVSERIPIDVPEPQRMHAFRRMGEIKAMLKKFMGELGYRDPHKVEDRGIMAPRHGLARAAQGMYCLAHDVVTLKKLEKPE